MDDGKSTLIGRPLYDSKLIFKDHLSAAERASRRYGTADDDIDLALLVDGLEAEREQNITIDVAYLYFATQRRAFIVADTPGHEQYLRNMATGASTADLAVLLVDARKGVLVQTRRHTIICSLLGIRSIVLAVNKIDLVEFSAKPFNRIVADYLRFASTLNLRSILPIPISARFGDNVTRRSERARWYNGPPLLEMLETIDFEDTDATKPFRFPIQWVSRPDFDFRGFAGTVASGAVSVGDPVIAARSGSQTRVARIVTFDGDRFLARAGEAVVLTLVDEIDIARGDLLSSPENRPKVADQFAATVLWMSEEAMLPGRSYILRMGTRTVLARITTLKHKVDVNTLEHRPARVLELNDIGFCNISTANPVVFDSYAKNRRTGAFVLIDRYTNATAGAGMVSFALRRASNVHHQHRFVNRAARAQLMHQLPCAFWFTGLSGSGKSTIANLVERILHMRGVHTTMLDGDNLRQGLNCHLGFTAADRVENIKRVGEVAKLFVGSGLVVLNCFISPFRAERQMVREMLGEGEFIEIFVDTPIGECIQRDPKGLYAKAMDGKIKNFTGIDSPYESPRSPDIHIRADRETAEKAAARIVDWFISRSMCRPK